MKPELSWVLASTVAFGLGGWLGMAVSPSSDIIVVGYLALAASLLLAGVLQWLVLRRRIADAGRWVLASVVAAAVVGVLVFGLGLLHRDAGWVLGVVVGWNVLGVLQWIVLRPQVARAEWWVPANALGLIVAVPVVALVSWATGEPPDGILGESLRWLAFGAAYGAMTGAALWWLRRQRRPAADAA